MKFVGLNLVLAIGICAVVWQARVRWEEVQAVRSANLNAPIKAVTPLPVTPAPKPEAAVATKYAEVADKNLFTPDRNPNIVIPPPAVDKPKSMPPLPVVFGVMGLPSGTKALMAEKSGSPSRAIRTGDTIGEFKVDALDMQNVTFEWDGKKLDKKIEDLIDRSNSQPVPGGAAPAQPVAAPAAAATAPPQPVNNNPVRADFGPAAGSNFTCKVGDSAAAGAVVDGYRKVVSQTIFGSVCRWVKQ